MPSDETLSDELARLVASYKAGGADSWDAWELIADFAVQNSEVICKALASRRLQADAIDGAIKSCGGNMTKAAKALGIGRSTIYRHHGAPDRRALATKK